MIVVRTGGGAGLRREWRMTVDGDDASTVESLVASADWRTVGVDPASRDRFVWSITVTGAAGRRRATLPEARLDGAMQDLVARVQEHSAPEAGAASDPSRKRSAG